MTIARVAGQTAQATGSSSASSLQVTLPQSVVAGNFISACGGHRTAFSSMTDNLSNTYDLDIDFNGAGGVANGDREIVVTSCKKIVTGGSCTITFAATGTSRIALVAMEYSGFGSAGAKLEDTATKNEETTTTGVETNLATLAASEGLGIACSMDSGFGVPYDWSGSSFSTVGESNGDNGRTSMADRVLSGANDYEATAVMSSSNIYVAGLAIYSPLAGPPTRLYIRRTRPAPFAPGHAR